jgi:hypothetical protein
MFTVMPTLAMILSLVRFDPFRCRSSDRDFRLPTNLPDMPSTLQKSSPPSISIRFALFQIYSHRLSVFTISADRPGPSSLAPRGLIVLGADTSRHASHRDIPNRRGAR